MQIREMPLNALILDSIPANDGKRRYKQVIQAKISNGSDFLQSPEAIFTANGYPDFWPELDERWKRKLGAYIKQRAEQQILQTLIDGPSAIDCLVQALSLSQPEQLDRELLAEIAEAASRLSAKLGEIGEQQT